MEPIRFRPLLAALAGAAVLAAGVWVATATLPVGRASTLPARSLYADRFARLAREHGLELVGSEPRVRLVAGEGDTHAIRRVLGQRTDAWLVRHRRGAQVQVTQTARWAASQGI